MISRRLFSGSKVTDKTIRMLTKKLMCYFHTGGKHKQGRLPNLRLCCETLYMIPKYKFLCASTGLDAFGADLLFFAGVVQTKTARQSVLSETSKTSGK